MSLKEFLEFRKECPICNNPNLSVYFTSKKNQEHFLENASYTVKIPLLDLNHQRAGNVCYSFALDSNAFWIDFCDKHGNKMDNSCHISFLKKFLKLNKNMMLQRFYKICGSCKRYNYISSYFQFDLKSGTLNGLEGNDTEYFGLIQKRENDYKLFRIINYFDTQRSTIEYGFDYKINSLYADSESDNSWDEPVFYALEMPLINFTSEERIIERLNKLIIFS